MKTNVGSTDRVIRIVVALVAAYLAWKGGFSSILSTILYIVAAAMLITSFVKFCPFYTFLGINTCKAKK